MKKPTLKRMLIGLVQHLIAAGILLTVAALLLNSYIEVGSIDGTQTYKIFPVNSAQEFEESDVYNDLFRNAVSDITQLVGIKGQLETDGVLDPSKRISVTEYAGKIYISSRSIDEINVQLIMEKLGGGGHLNVAGAQLTGYTIVQAKHAIMETLDEMLEKGDIQE